MLDVGANLFSALPQAFGAASRIPLSRSLVKPDESNSGGNSLKSVSNTLKPESAVADFSPPVPGEQGFGSLSPVLKSLRPKPQSIAPLPEDGPARWEQLLDKQQEITDARRKYELERQEREQARQQAAAERIVQQQIAQEIREESIFIGEPKPQPLPPLQQTPDTQQPEEQLPQFSNATKNEPEPAPLVGQGDNNESADPQAEDTDQIYPPDTEFPKIVTSPAPEQEFELQVPDQAPVPQPEQQRVEQLFSGAQDRENTGTNINLFA